MKKKLKNIFCHACFIIGMFDIFFKLYKKLFNVFPLVILCYHNFVDSFDDVIDDNPAVNHLITSVEKQLRFLKKYFKFITMDNAIDRLTKNEFFYEPSIVITVDDGRLSNYTHLFPILKKEKISATIYLISAFVGSSDLVWTEKLAEAIWKARKAKLVFDKLLNKKIIDIKTKSNRRLAYFYIINELKKMPEKEKLRILDNIIKELDLVENNNPQYLNWTQIREMDSYGITFGAHSHSHPILTNLPKEKAEKEILMSKIIIEKKLGKDVFHFAYPNGGKNDFNDELREFSQKIGFLSVSSCESKILNSNNNILNLNRICSTEPINIFLFNLIFYLVKNFPKQMRKRGF